MSFDQLELRDELLKAVVAKGYAAPTPVQARAIPVILAGRDILARAQTGTGKTDAFALPMVEILSRHIYGDRHPRALVLAPTRELALQVGESIKAYARRGSCPELSEYGIRSFIFGIVSCGKYVYAGITGTFQLFIFYVVYKVFIYNDLTCLYSYQFV